MIRSKIYLFLILFIAYVSFSCNKKNDVIPDVYVDFYIDIDDARFITELSSIGSSITVNQSTNNDPDAGGYAGSGIIITTVGIGEYYAYDRTCPYNYEFDKSIIQVKIDPTAFGTAICPECHSTFSLINSGQPVSGPSRNYLKNYAADFNGEFIHVWNK